MPPANHSLLIVGQSSSSSSAPHFLFPSDPGVDVTGDHSDPLPVYSLNADSNGISLHDLDFDAQAVPAEDGRVTISVDSKTARLTTAASLFKAELLEEAAPPTYDPYTIVEELARTLAPRMNIVIHVVGSRGDVQPFLALARVLKEVHGHHVRLATHPKFEAFVERAGIEFFSIGGDPAELMDFMVKNAGLLPSVDSLLNGDVGRQQQFMGNIIEGCWRSCIEPCAKTGRPFIADAIIANPPSFAHIHCAERLSVPLHLMFTMPWTPSLSFPHPLANIQPTSADPQTINLLSFHLVEMLTWQGLGDIINEFRVKTLELESLSSLYAPGLTWRLKIPCTYAWSPALLPRPLEWGAHVNISGYFTDPTHTTHDPSPELARFLENGEAPIYIGFGSIKFDNSAKITDLILAAIERCGVRAIISHGWAKLGSDIHPDQIPDTVLFIDDTPHPWLFPQCSAVIHHGGAGTTACGLEMGRPTVVVPFFGDQWFWGDMVARRGAGPKPIPFKQLSLERLSEAIDFVLRPECREVAQDIADSMKREDGCQAGAAFFHAALLNLDENQRNSCSLYPEHVACWKIRLPLSSGKNPSRSRSISLNDSNEVKLSAIAAAVLISEEKIDVHDLELLRVFEHDNSKANVPWDPISSLLANTTTTVSDVLKGVTAGPREAYKQINSSKARAKTQRQHSSSESTPQVSWDASTLDTERASLASQRTASTEFQDAQSTGSTIKRKPLATATATRKDDDNKSGRGTKSPSHDLTSSSASSSSLNAAGAVAMESTKGIGRIMGAGLKTPVTFTNGLARGFHNVPTIYGDDTVRPEAKIDGVRSGLVAAGKGFGYGLYDGLTGLVTQPYNGAKKEGAVGFFKGVGKGLGGVVFKPSAGACGVPGYAFMGVYKSVMKLGKGSKATLEDYIAAVRLAQGEEESKILEKRQWDDIVGRWGIEVATRRTNGRGGGLNEERLSRQGSSMSERSFRR